MTDRDADQGEGVLDKLRGSPVGTNDPNIVGDAGPLDQPPGRDPDTVIEDGAGFAAERDGESAVLHVSGEIDMVTSPELKQRLSDLAHDGVPVVVLDLTDCRFFDSSGLNAVVSGHRALRHHGGELRVVCTERRVTKVFEIAGLTRVFPLHQSVDAALTADE